MACSHWTVSRCATVKQTPIQQRWVLQQIQIRGELQSATTTSENREQVLINHVELNKSRVLSHGEINWS